MDNFTYLHEYYAPGPGQKVYKPGQKLAWVFKRDREFPHLNTWRATYRGMRIAFLMPGTDWNVQSQASGSLRREYETFISFPSFLNTPHNALMNILDVSGHQFHSTLIRESIEEVFDVLESEVIDLWIMFANYVGKELQWDR